MVLAAGTLLQERYLIVRHAGQGGMGAVYEAIDQRLGTTVALKQTLITDPQFDKAFAREARLLAALRHPALTRVIDFFSDSHGQFLVMEFIPGDDLAIRMNGRSEPLPVEDVLAWADQLLDALAYLHSRQPPVIHRDIKPQNLKLTASGEIVLLDFGLAKGLVHSATQATTSASLFGYTLQFAPLEQIQGTGTDHRSDLYSLSATLYFLLSGVAPPNALTRATAVLSRQPDPLGPASAHNPLVPPQLDAVLIQAMALDPNARFASAAAMRAALRGLSAAATAWVAAPVPPEVIRSGTSSTGPTQLVAMAAPTVPSAPSFQPPTAPAAPQLTPARPGWMARLRRLPPWAIVAIVIMLAPLAMCARAGFVDTFNKGPLLPPPPPQARREIATLLARVVEETIVPDAGASGIPAQPDRPGPDRPPPSPVPSPSAGQSSAMAVGGLTPGQTAWIDPDETPALFDGQGESEVVLERPRLYGGAEVTVIAFGQESVQVRTPEGLLGWLHAPANEVLVAERPREGEGDAFRRGYLIEIVLKSGIPLRQEPRSTASQLIENLGPGTVGVLEELRGDWLLARLASGESGWLRWYYDGERYVGLLPATRMDPPFQRTLELEDEPMQGDDVRQVQQRLLDLGYVSVSMADGLLGPNTEQAIRAFQLANGLAADGIVGEQTWQALFSTAPQGAPPG